MRGNVNKYSVSKLDYSLNTYEEILMTHPTYSTPLKYGSSAILLLRGYYFVAYDFLYNSDTPGNIVMKIDARTGYNINWAKAIYITGYPFTIDSL